MTAVLRNDQPRECKEQQFENPSHAQNRNVKLGARLESRRRIGVPVHADRATAPADSATTRCALPREHGCIPEAQLLGLPNPVFLIRAGSGSRSQRYPICCQPAVGADSGQLIFCRAWEASDRAVKTRWAVLRLPHRLAERLLLRPSWLPDRGPFHALFLKAGALAWYLAAREGANQNFEATTGSRGGDQHTKNCVDRSHGCWCESDQQKRRSFRSF